MAIDGRDIARARESAESGGPSAPKPGKRDAYESPVIRVVSHALFWVPVVFLVWFAYVSGTWMGGWVGGVLSVASTVLTIGVLWLWYRMRQRRRGRLLR
jgi:hypothetical protein